MTTSFEPVVWDPPAVRDWPVTGRIDRPERWPVPGAGPEDVVIDAGGWAIVGLADGRIMRVAPGGQASRQLAFTGGRPLGIEWLDDERLLVCDADRGLLAVHPAKRTVEPVLTEVAGEPLVLTNNATVASDGTIYVSESSRRNPLSRFREDILEHGSSGRVLRITPDGEVDEVLTGLTFANGVTLTADETSLVVAETGTYAVHRVTLTGPKQGRARILVDALPGFPDNCSTGADGTVWVAIASPRVPMLDALLGRPAAIRRAVEKLPERLQPDAVRAAVVVGIDVDAGEVTHHLVGDGEAFHYVTGVREHDGWLYLGSLVEPALARVPVPT